MRILLRYLVLWACAEFGVGPREVVWAMLVAPPLAVALWALVALAIAAGH